jgi:hypothetical protein
MLLLSIGSTVCSTIKPCAIFIGACAKELLHIVGGQKQNVKRLQKMVSNTEPCNPLTTPPSYVRGGSEIKLKNVNKKRMATARRLIFFFEFLKAIADLITLLFSLLQNSEGGGDRDSGDSVLTRANYYHFQRPKFNFQPLSFTFEPLAKNLQKQKSLLGSM